MPGYIAPSAQLPLLAELFGSGHAAWAPATFAAVLGGPQSVAGGPAATLFSASTTIPNDDAHWLQIPGADPVGVGTAGTPAVITNNEMISFSPLSSGDVSAWSSTGLTVTLQNGSGATVCTAAFYTPVGWLLSPYAGLVVGIGPGFLQWGIHL